MNTGTVGKRCSCTHPDTGKRLNASCPRLYRKDGTWNPKHGTWQFQIELPAPPRAPRKPLRRAGYATREDAQDALDHVRNLLALAGGDPATGMRIADIILEAKYGRPIPDRESVLRRILTSTGASPAITVGAYLSGWLRGHGSIAETTHAAYARHIRLYLDPHLGHHAIADLSVEHIQTMFLAIDARNADIDTARIDSDKLVRASVRGIRTVGAATKQRILATLRKALNDAITNHAKPLITFNPAAHISLPSGKRPTARVWDNRAVAYWRQSGKRPSPVMVWLPDQAGAFLDYAEAHDIALYPLYALIMSRGQRRGEACGLRDLDVNLDDAVMTIAQQTTTLGHTPITKDVKSAAGERVITIDPYTVTILREYEQRRARWQTVCGSDWPDTGFYFVRPDGQPWHPNVVSERFGELIHNAALPPIRLHDLRHCAASYLKLAGADNKTIQDTLGHASGFITSDTYTSVFTQFEKGYAADAAGLVHHTRRKEPHREP